MRFCFVFPVIVLVQSLQGADCGALKSVGLPDTTIVSATAVSGTFTPPVGNPVPDMPAFCRVAGIIRPTADSEIHFEVWLPESGWNQKYLGVGNGGFAGTIDYNALGGNVKRAHATAATDTGHQGLAVDASWAYKHPEKIDDFGWRALHLTTGNAKHLLEAYYGKPAQRAYFDSCSDGGREALMEAQRFPDDFDGILAGAPANYWTALVASGTESMQVLRHPDTYISSLKLPAISAAVLASCDAQDGVKDGIINDPARCHFDPASMQCKDGDALTCLTAPQVTFLKALYAGAPASGGKPGFPGHEPGGELGPGGWSSWILGEGPASGSGTAYFENYFRYMVYDDPAWSPFGATFDAALHAADEKTARALNATNPDLKAFEAHGGKLILYHGWSDPAIPPRNTINYYNSVQQKMGGEAAAQFTRLYMVPGMQHCLGGPGPSAIGQFGIPTAGKGVFEALEQWVETGNPPGQIVATKYKGDNPRAGVAMTRPLCPYPQVAKYKGSGSTDDAQSFTCALQ